MNERFTFDQYDSVFEYSAERHAYLFAGKLNGRTRDEFIRDHERAQYLEQLQEDAGGWHEKQVNG